MNDFLRPDEVGKFRVLVRSRKFWATVISWVVALGVLQLSGDAQAELVQAILTVVMGLGYIVSVALEDGLRR